MTTEFKTNKKITTELKELNNKKMTTKVENLISSISIEELNKVSDEEIVTLCQTLKNHILECDKDPEIEIIIEKNLSLGDEELQNKRSKNLKNFIIKHKTNTVPDGNKCEALKKIITKLSDKFYDETIINKLWSIIMGIDDGICEINVP